MVAAYRPKNLKDALEAIIYTEHIVLAGGTDLMVKKKRGAGLLPAFDKPVLFIADLEELKQISEKEGYLTIGAACSFSSLINNPLIPALYKQVFLQIASPAVRNIATIGGNICNSSPAGDSLPLLYALDASVIIENSCRRIEIPIADFITGPGRNMLTSSELVTAIRLPVLHFDHVVYKKVSARKSTALSKVSFVAMAKLKDSRLEDVRIAFGSVAPTIVRSRDVEEAIIYNSSNGSLDITEIISYYTNLIKPIDDQRSTAFYRRKVCKRLLVDFLDHHLGKSLREGDLT
jgi:CO/xanthine dehydrogenase FAD-binding subunit